VNGSCQWELKRWDVVAVSLVIDLGLGQAIHGQFGVQQKKKKGAEAVV